MDNADGVLAINGRIDIINMECTFDFIKGKLVICGDADLYSRKCSFRNEFTTYFNGSICQKINAPNVIFSNLELNNTSDKGIILSANKYGKKNEIKVKGKFTGNDTFVEVIEIYPETELS